MNKTAIRNFAVKARRKLIEEISHRAYGIGITEDKILEIETFDGGFKVKGREKGQFFKKYELAQRERLIQNIGHKGLEQVIEEVAYTWFNRLLALRFMEVNNYLPTGVRVLSSLEKGKLEPDIIKEALNIDLDIDREIVFRLQDRNDTEGLYKYLLVKQCNQLGEIMPAVFEEIADYTELLLPDKLLAEGSVIRDLVREIEEYDWKIELCKEEKEQEAEKGEHGIEIIGWLYQYYISEKKDEVFAGLKKNKKITKENIPAATQLFTPKWIVKYMVENSLGRLWMEKIAGSGHLPVDSKLKEKWKYYLDEAEQEPEVEEELRKIRAGYKDLMPEDIRLLDPAMGSGHILVYAFDLLYDIYLSKGYSEREIPALILERNLYGLSICDRAGQLAAFALLMKARSKNRRIFRNRPKMSLCAIQESNGIAGGGKELVEYFIRGLGENERVRLKEDLGYLLETFHDAKEYGSIIEVKEIDFDALENRIEEIRNNAPEDIFGLQYRKVILEKIPPLIQQGRIMSQKYDVVCTNPPYMGRRGMNPKLAKYLKKHYNSFKSDLYAVFIKKCINSSKAYISMITQHTWMFVMGFEKARKFIRNKSNIHNMIHLGSRAFEEIGGEIVQSCAFVLRKDSPPIKNSIFIRLTDIGNSLDKEIEYLSIINSCNSSYRLSKINSGVFNKIPGSPIAYWLSEKMVKCFAEGKTLNEIADLKTGLSTTDNDRFLRFWYETRIMDIGFNLNSRENALTSNKRWFPYVKGGVNKKWFGNRDFVVNWYKDGVEIRNNAKGASGGRIVSTEYYFKESLTWSYLSTDKFALRYNPTGSIFDSIGTSCFLNDQKDKWYTLGLLNTKLVFKILEVLAPTMAFNPGSIGKIPIIKGKGYYTVINNLVNKNVFISKTDWDSFETSWDFKCHPLLQAAKGQLNTREDQTTHRPAPVTNYSLSTAFNIWSTFTENQFNQLKTNEEELNRIFIEIYGLQDELTPEVADEDITINKADRERDIKSFISYAVACMFGRYSLDEEGLIYAGGDFDDQFRMHNEDWKIKTEEGWKKSRVSLAEHNVIPIADGDYFEEDILERFVEFVKISFGAEALEENLEYIAENLGRRARETSRQAIRRYFLGNFYKDHVRTYKKRPIYWMFNSGRQNAFKALIYMHRYDPFTVARVRTDYLHSLQKKYEAEISHLDILIDSQISTREKADARKKKEALLKKVQECIAYDQVIAHLANKRIEIDLDDGVKVNYAKFQRVEVPLGEGRKPLKADLLAKI